MKVTIEKSQGEYRVPSEDGYEDGAYYTDDKEDAVAVAKKVFGDNVEIKYRSVAEFSGGKYEKYRPKKESKEFDADSFINEAKSKEEQQAFEDAEKSVAKKVGFTLPLSKDKNFMDMDKNQQRIIRNKFYAQVNAKMKSKMSNVQKVLEALTEKN